VESLIIETIALLALLAWTAVISVGRPRPDRLAAGHQHLP
jgi:hypothetical protein